MFLRNIYVAVFFLAATGFSQTITIRGKVTDTSGVSPIADAVVRLEKLGLSTSTGLDGSFTLHDSTDIHAGSFQQHARTISACAGNGFVCLEMPKKSAVDIIFCTVQGKIISHTKTCLENGTHKIPKPAQGRGMYVCRIKAGNDGLVIKTPAAVLRRGTLALASSSGVSEASDFKTAQRHSPINDIITVIKSGYLKYAVLVTNSDTSGIEIRMIVCADTLRDIDGNFYQAVRIGNQVWTVENLRTARLRDGTSIPLVTDNTTWNGLAGAAYCYYNNTTNADTIKTFGPLYNWHAVSTGKLALAGWHVPTNVEWNTLQDYLIAAGHNWDGTTAGNKIGKSLASAIYWNTFSTPGTPGYDVTKNNRSGFSGLPGGYRFNTGNYYSIGYTGYWWSATNHDINYAWQRDVGCDLEQLYSTTSFKNCGFSVRLVRD